MKTYEELARAFVKCHRGKLLFVAGQWVEAVGSSWQPITNRKMNRLIRNTGWHAVNAASVRRHMEEEPLWGFIYSGPLPAVEITGPALNVEMTPVVRALAGDLIYDQTRKWWLRRDGSQWVNIFDRDVNRLIRKITGPRGVENVRRTLEGHIGFAVKEMVS